MLVVEHLDRYDSIAVRVINYFIFLSLFGAAFGEDLEKTSLDQLTKNLGAETFSVRENSQKELVRRGLEKKDSILQAIQDEWVKNDDPEVRERCEAIIWDFISSRSYIGVYMQESPAAKSPVIFTEIIPNSPAEKAGLQASDSVLEIDGKKVTSLNVCREILSQKQPNSMTKIVVWRDNKEVVCQVKVGKLTLEKASELERNQTERSAEAEKKFDSILRDLKLREQKLNDSSKKK